MKGVRWRLLLLAALLILLTLACMPGYQTIGSVTRHVVEVTANARDNTLLDLSSWCRENNKLMLWYDLVNQPSGFNDRNSIFDQTASDKSVYADNQYVGNYGNTNLDGIKNSITNKTTDPLTGSLILLLRAKDLLGTEYDLIIGESGETKVAVTNYVLVEFQMIDNTKRLYKVKKVQAGGDWKNFNVPKAIPSTELSNTGFAFFRIDGGKVVDARVIYP